MMTYTISSTCTCMIIKLVCPETCQAQCYAWMKKNPITPKQKNTTQAAKKVETKYINYQRRKPVVKTIGIYMQLQKAEKATARELAMERAMESVGTVVDGDILDENVQSFWRARAP